MTRREDFEAAIRADRYDRDLRMVYADWLEDNGLDDEAAWQRAWTREWEEADDYLHNLTIECGSSMDDLVRAVKLWLETRQQSSIGEDFLGFDAINHIDAHGGDQTFWRHWEAWTRTSVDDAKKLDIPFGCCI